MSTEVFRTSVTSVGGEEPREGGTVNWSMADTFTFPTKQMDVFRLEVLPKGRRYGVLDDPLRSGHQWSAKVNLDRHTRVPTFRKQLYGLIELDKPTNSSHDQFQRQSGP